MDPILFIDRQTGKTHEEKVYFGEAVRFLYGRSFLSKIFGWPITYLISRFPLFSSLFGWWNDLPRTKKKIQPFIDLYSIDISEFREPVESFPCFNAFFIRKLSSKCRPLAGGNDVAIIPADGRYLFYPNISKSDGFLVKREKFLLADLLQSEVLAHKYEQGTMIIARLCPTDYHRYHFPVNNTPGESKLINGYLYSVNPIAIKQDIAILTKNKRVICSLDSEEFGKILFIEVGATNVGSINQTYTPGKFYQKGDEKGYFSFGASTLILLFEPGRLQLDADLLEASAKKIEIRCLMGQKMGRKNRE